MLCGNAEKNYDGTSGWECSLTCGPCPFLIPNYNACVRQSEENDRYGSDKEK